MSPSATSLIVETPPCSHQPGVGLVSPLPAELRPLSCAKAACLAARRSRTPKLPHLLLYELALCSAPGENTALFSDLLLRRRWGVGGRRNPIAATQEAFAGFKAKDLPTAFVLFGRRRGSACSCPWWIPKPLPAQRSPGWGGAKLSGGGGCFLRR